MTEQTRADLVKEMIELIRPDNDREAECRKEIVERIHLIAKINASTPDFFPHQRQRSRLSLNNCTAR